MNNIFLLMFNSLRVTFRKKGNFVVFLILPLIGFVVSVMLYGGAGTSSLNIGIVNNDNGIIAADMIEELKNTENNRLLDIKEEEMNDKLLGGALSCVVIIPEGFSSDIAGGITPEVNIITVQGRQSTIWVERFTELYVSNMLDMAAASKGDEALFNRVYQAYKASALTLEVEKLEDETTSKFVTLQGLGFLIMFVLVGAVLTSELMLKEKRNRTYHRICAAPVSSRTYVIGNVLANMTIVFVQLLFVLFLVAKLLNVNAYVNDGILLLILTCFGLVAVGFGMLIVAFAGSSYQSGTLSTLIITPTCMIGGCFWPVDVMPSIMRTLSNFTPQRWALKAVQTMQKGGTLEDIAINLLVLLAFAAVLFAVSAYKLSNTDDMRKFV